MRFLVDVCQILAGLLLAPVAGLLALTTGKYRTDWGQRMGRVPRLPESRPRVWIHAVSVGEVNAIRGLVNLWRERVPGIDFVISTTTDTGKAQAQRVFPDLPVVRYPLDVSWWVTRALRRIRPTMIVLVELEVWYQFVTLATRMRIPVVVVNGRLSERSGRRFGWIRPISRRMFGSLAWVGAQDESYAQRFRRTGVPAERVTVTGSVKWDGASLADDVPGAAELAQAVGLSDGHPLWVCGSTGPGEEKVILQAYGKLRSSHPSLQLAIVPRKPERFDEAAELIRQSGYQCTRRSIAVDEEKTAINCLDPEDNCLGPEDNPRGPLEDNRGPEEHCPSRENSRRGHEKNCHAVVLGDTMGELRKFYRLADVVFVGRSLAAMGGSDMMEVAGLAKPIVAGPHNENFEETVRRLREDRAIRIVESELNDASVADKLAAAVDELLSQPALAKEMADRGREVVRRNRGATGRTLEHLMEIFARAQHQPA